PRSRPRSCRAPMTAVGVVRGACALARHHAGPERLLGCARSPEHSALVRLRHPAEDVAAPARLRILDARTGYLEMRLRIPLGELGGDAKAAVGDRAQPAPLEVVADFEHVVERGE